MPRAVVVRSLQLDRRVKMRSLFLVWMLVGALTTGVLAQKAETPKPKPGDKSGKEQQASSTSSEKKPEAAKPTEEKSPEPSKTAETGDKEQNFDVSEVPPIVTHHQITVEGKPLKYTATAGRLPIKRPDGKI